MSINLTYPALKPHWNHVDFYNKHNFLSLKAFSLVSMLMSPIIVLLDTDYVRGNSDALLIFPIANIWEKTKVKFDIGNFYLRARSYKCIWLRCIFQFLERLCGMLIL